MRFTIYVAKEFEPCFNAFVKNQSNPSRRICNIVKTDVNNLNIPLLRQSLLASSDELKRVKELMKEFERI